MNKSCLWCEWSERLRNTKTNKLTRLLGCSAKMAILDDYEKRIDYGCKIFKSIEIPECNGCKCFFIDGVKDFRCRMGHVHGGNHIVTGEGCEKYYSK